jgi:hypothetical protein
VVKLLGMDARMPEQPWMAERRARRQTRRLSPYPNPEGQGWFFGRATAPSAVVFITFPFKKGNVIKTTAATPPKRGMEKTGASSDGLGMPLLRYRPGMINGVMSECFDGIGRENH